MPVACERTRKGRSIASGLNGYVVEPDGTGEFLTKNLDLVGVEIEQIRGGGKHG